MGMFPCSIGEHRFPGFARGFYAGYMNGEDERRLRLRLCERHWREVEPRLAEFELTYEGTPAADSDLLGLCATCLEPLKEGVAQVFTTGYPTKNDRKDYWFQIHPACPVPEWYPAKFELK